MTEQIFLAKKLIILKKRDKLILQQTGMPGVVMVRIRIRQYDNKVSQNISNNRRSTKSILYITK